MNNKIKMRNIIILVFICIGLGFFAAYHFFVAPLNSSSIKEILNPNNISKKLDAKEVIVDKMYEKHELITLEVDLSENMTIDDSWGSLEIFKKISSINFVGTGTYALPLDDIKSDNISVANKNITIKIPEPVIKMVNIDENKTTFGPTEKGILRFGDIKMTPAENDQLIKTVKEKMLSKMQNSELYNKAKESSSNALREFLKSILTNRIYNQYNIKIEY